MEDIAVPQGKWLLQTAAGSVLGRMVRPPLWLTLSFGAIARHSWGHTSRTGKGVASVGAACVLSRAQVIALAKKRGVKTINVVRRSEQKQELLDLGCAAEAGLYALQTLACPPGTLPCPLHAGQQPCSEQMHSCWLRAGSARLEAEFGL